MKFSKTMLIVAAFVTFLAAACGKEDKHDNEEVTIRPEIPLNLPSDILGTWSKCTDTTGAKTSSTDGEYTFIADGSLEYKSTTFSTNDCSGTANIQLVLKGSYIVGTGNSLDISFPIGKPSDKKSITQYRVFSVQGDTLLISNNAGPGADSAHRDYDLSSNALKLQKRSN